MPYDKPWNKKEEKAPEQNVVSRSPYADDYKKMCDMCGKNKPTHRFVTEKPIVKFTYACRECYENHYDAKKEVVQKLIIIRKWVTIYDGQEKI